jgi:hypothetical protein
MSARKIALLFHLLFFLILFLAFFVPGFFYWCLLVFNLLFLFFNNRLRRFINYKNNIFYLVLPWIFINSLFFYVSLLASKFLILIFLILGILVSFYYFSGLKKHLSRGSSLPANNFFIWTDALGLLSVFLFSSFSYGLNYFVNISDLVTNLLIILVLFLAVWQNISIVLEDYKKIFSLSLIFILGILPIIIALSFSPFNFNVLGLVLSIVYYSSLSFIRFYLLKSLTIKKIKFNLLFTATLLLLIFLAVKWR